MRVALSCVLYTSAAARAETFSVNSVMDATDVNGRPPMAARSLGWPQEADRAKPGCGADDHRRDNHEASLRDLRAAQHSDVEIDNRPQGS